MFRHALRSMMVVFVLAFSMTGQSLAQDQQKKLALLRQLLATHFSTSWLEEERDEKVRQTLHVVKDEFETGAMFESRKADAQLKADGIKVEYDRRIADLRSKFDQRMAELRHEMKELLASSATAVSSDFTLGQYDADKGFFPITISLTKDQFPVKVPLAAARDFKSSSSTLKARGTRYLKEDGGFEYANWTIVDQSRGATYTFGPQRTGATPAAPSVHAAPPNLSVAIAFKEPSGNNRLDGEESGELLVTVRNSGKGTAFGVEVMVRSQAIPGVRIPSGAYIGEIPAGESRQASLALFATSEATDGTVACELDFKESYGFQPGARKVSFETRQMLNPKLIVADFGIDDQSGNGRIEPTEITQLKVRIQNTGAGAAKGVKATVKLGSNVFFMAGSTSSFDLGDMTAGGYKDIAFSIYTNNIATAVPVSIDVTEARGRFEISNHQLPLAFNKPVARVEDMVIVGTDDKLVVPAVAGGLSVDVDVNIPAGSRTGESAVAVVFGIETYRHVPSVTFAKRDAAVFREYAIRTLGVPDDPSALYYKTDDEVTKAEFDKVFSPSGWLAKRVHAGTDVFVYYAGHGAPEVNERKPYLIPTDGDPNYPTQTGFSLATLYEHLSALKVRSVTVFLDACFSGGTREEKMLLADARPIAISVENPALTSARVTAFAAASGTQVSSGYPEKRHGLFTYFLLKGLQGGADVNKDKKVTAEELDTFIGVNVSRQAGMLDREQTPQAMGSDKARVIVHLK